MEPEDAQILREGCVDFISISYYRSTLAARQQGKQSGNPLNLGEANPYLPCTEWGITIDPLGFRIVLHNLYDRYGLSHHGGRKRSGCRGHRGGRRKGA